MQTAQTLHFLDLDLDTFLNGVAHWRWGECRLPENYLKPWTEERLVKFLENQCQLTTDKPIPGRFVQHHDEAFDYWKELLSNTDLKLEIVDGHADLGMGEQSWIHIVCEHLHLPLGDRHTPIRDYKHCSSGSYLTYALASRLITQLTYIYPEGGGEDLIPIYFKNNDLKSGIIELKAFHPAQVDEALRFFDHHGLNSETATAIEPPVRFSHMPIDTFQANKKFDYALLAQSPAFTPASSDALIDIISQYIEFDHASFCLK